LIVTGFFVHFDVSAGAAEYRCASADIARVFIDATSSSEGCSS